jgi:hypothetical protein
MVSSTLTIEKRSVGFLFGMNTLMLGANLVWVAYITILLPTLVEKVVTVNKGLVVGLLGFFGTLLGLLVTILWGIISDHTTSKLGKRTPAILTGSLIALPLIGLPSLMLSPALHDFLIPLALPIILISYFGMQFATNLSNGAWWPLLVDVVPENQRGWVCSGSGHFIGSDRPANHDLMGRGRVRRNHVVNGFHRQFHHLPGVDHYSLDCAGAHPGDCACAGERSITKRRGWALHGI